MKTFCEEIYRLLLSQTILRGQTFISISFDVNVSGNHRTFSRIIFLFDSISIDWSIISSTCSLTVSPLRSSVVPIVAAVPLSSGSIKLDWGSGNTFVLSDGLLLFLMLSTTLGVTSKGSSSTEYLKSLSCWLNINFRYFVSN